MRHFAYRNGVLHAEDVDLRAFAEGVGTPFYCYATATLERHYRVFADAFSDADALVCFAMKANSNQAVLRTLARLGAGMDIVSEGELRRALAAGVPGERIVFSGVGKTREEMAAALDGRHPLLQRRKRAGTRGAVRGRGRQRACAPRSRSGSTRTWTPGRTRRSRPANPRTSSASRSRAPATSTPKRRALPGLRGRRRRHAHRQPDHRSGALRQRDRSFSPSSPAT